MKLQQHSKHSYAPAFSVLPTGICLYNYYLSDRSSYGGPPASNKHESTSLSKKQSARIRKYINWLYLVSSSKSVYQRSTNKYFKFRVNFITLTLSNKQYHTDKDIKKLLLDPFLRSLRRNNPSLLYVWKAEVQDNGNIHFHINTNIFVHHEKLRALWNKYQFKNGYAPNNGNPNPNSTDIKAVKNAKDLGLYMAGYIAKKDLYKSNLKRWHKRYKKVHEKEKVSCNIPRNYFKSLKRKINIKLWDCSSILKKVKISTYGHSNELENAIRESVAGKECVQGDYFEYYCDMDWFSMKPNKLQSFIFDRLTDIRLHVKDIAKKYVIE